MQSTRKHWHMHTEHASQLTRPSALLIFPVLKDCVRGQGVNAIARRFSGDVNAIQTQYNPVRFVSWTS